MTHLDDNSSGILNLWPTRFLHRVLPGAEQANAVLQSLLLAQEQQHTAGSLTADYKEQDLFSLAHPAVDWLKACVNKSVGDYLASQMIDYNLNWSLQGWANINRQGDYHNLHNHPHSYLSGTYYVAVPTQSQTQTEAQVPLQRTDLNPGAISFFDPRAQANMGAIKGDDQIDPEYRVLPVPGTIMLWPSFVHHWVHPNTSNDLRISISFNVLLSKLVTD